MNAGVAKIVADAITAYLNSNDLQCLTGVTGQIASLVAPDCGPEIGWQFVESSHLAGNLGARLAVLFEARYGPLDP